MACSLFEGVVGHAAYAAMHDACALLMNHTDPWSSQQQVLEWTVKDDNGE
jgi:hypothetical protein